MLKLKFFIFALLVTFQVINCEENKININHNQDQNEKLNDNIDGQPGKLTNLLDDIKSKQIKNEDILREFLQKLRQISLVSEKFKHLFHGQIKPNNEENDSDMKLRSEEDDELVEDEFSDIQHSVQNDDYVEDNLESQENANINQDEKETYVYDDLLNQDALNLDNYEYIDSKDLDDEKNKVKSDKENNVRNVQEDALVNELKTMKSKYPFRIRRSVKKS